MLIGRSVFPSPCGRSPRADEVMAFGRRTVTMSFSGLRPIFAIGGSAGAVCGSVEPRGPAVPRRMGLRRRFAALMSRAGRSLRTRRPATALTLRAGAPQAADRLCRPNRTGCYAGCRPPSQTAGAAGCGPILSLIVNEASNSIIEVTVFEAPAARSGAAGFAGESNGA